MLIKALCDYYDIRGNSLPEGYSSIKPDYLICLTPDGKIGDIVNYQEDVIMPSRTEIPGIGANIIEHRCLYIFGLNLANGVFTPNDKTNKAKKSHEDFVNKNLKFIDGINTPVVNAFREFILSWNPENETENVHLKGIEKNYGNAKFVFCLSGETQTKLHEDVEIKKRWEENYKRDKSNRAVVLQCAISGENRPIARIHKKIRGVTGGQSTGTTMVSFNNPSEYSYGNERSYNSAISEEAMNKYTEALNYLLSSKEHRASLEDITVIFWAMNKGEKCENNFYNLLYGNDSMDDKQTDEMLRGLIFDASKGKISSERVSSTEGVDPDVDFYIVGLKPNVGRVAIKFIYRKKFGDMLMNIAKFQEDLQVSNYIRPVSLWRIKKELASPKSEDKDINSILLSKLFEAIIYGTNYPTILLSTVVRRAKTDTDNRLNGVRAGLIKACINRKSRLLNQREELTLSLDTNNTNQAYVCGRLFAVLEELQQQASNNSLNRTIRDTHFASASSRPGVVFPDLLQLAQHHLRKVGENGYFNQTDFNKLIGEIIDKLDGSFPNNLLLTNQGNFMVGYYQQHQDFLRQQKNKDKQEDN